MKLYIDPGTGSMLFAILIGIIGARELCAAGLDASSCAFS